MPVEVGIDLVGPLGVHGRRMSLPLSPAKLFARRLLSLGRPPRLKLGLLAQLCRFVSPLVETALLPSAKDRPEHHTEQKKRSDRQSHDDPGIHVRVLSRSPDGLRPSSCCPVQRGDKPPCRVRAVLAITAGSFRFAARLEEESAPRTIAALRTLLPLRSQLVQARWSGESAWVPMGFELELGIGPENANSYPAAGELLLYPGGLSEVEILFPYGATCFASKMGQLAGNHFATIVEGRDQLAELGRVVLWDGAQPIVFEES